jgi:hypothetical protein
MCETREIYSLYKFLLKLCDGRYEQTELNAFIEKLVKIGEDYIGYSYNRIKKLVNPNQSSSRNISLEAITPLFLNADYNNHFVIVDIIKKWDPPIKSEEESLFFLNKVISNRIEQHISLKLRESDPLYSKLLDSVNYLIRSSNYNKVNYLGKVYITEPPGVKIEWIVINDSEFQNIPSHLFFERKVLLNSLFKFIKTETTYFPAIPLSELIFRLKRINQINCIYQNSSEYVVEQIEVKETVNSGLNFVEDKLKTSYYEKAKLTYTEYKSFKKALNMLAADLGNGGLNTNLCTYLHLYFDDITKETYRQKYHNIFEYLVKLFKNKVAEELNLNKNVIYSICQFLSFYLLQDNEILNVMFIL